MSDRVLDSDVLAGILAGTIKPCLFIFADFPSNPKRLWTGLNDTTWDSHTWTGVGGLVSFSTVSETTDTSVRGLKAKIDSLDPDIVAAIVNDNYQGHEATVYFGLFQSSGSLVVEPTPLWKGTLETDEWEDRGSDSSLEISAEHRLTDILRKREFRYTNQDQQFLYPGDGDIGLTHMEKIQDVSVPWGRTQQ